MNFKINHYLSNQAIFLYDETVKKNLKYLENEKSF